MLMQYTCFPNYNYFAQFQPASATELLGILVGFSHKQRGEKTVNFCATLRHKVTAFKATILCGAAINPITRDCQSRTLLPEQDCSSWSLPWASCGSFWRTSWSEHPQTSPAEAPPCTACKLQGKMVPAVQTCPLQAPHLETTPSFAVLVLNTALEQQQAPKSD